MASEVSICNLALQLLGAERITALTEDSVNARECNSCYAEMRDLELEKHRWNFAITRVTLAPDTAAPNDTYDYAFSWPADCLRILPPNRSTLDWQQEGRKILTNEGDSLDVVYVKQVTDPNVMVPTFRASVAARMALQMCEKLTQSNSKKQDAKDAYKEAINEARKTNALQRLADEAPEDDWITARNNGASTAPWLTWGG